MTGSGAQPLFCWLFHTTPPRLLGWLSEMASFKTDDVYPEASRPGLILPAFQRSQPAIIGRRPLLARSQTAITALFPLPA